MPAPVGNQNAANAKMWRAAIMRALEKRSKPDQLSALNECADELVKLCLGGDLPALRELGDRLDGKPAQAVTGLDGGPIRIEQIRRVIVDASNAPGA